MHNFLYITTRKQVNALLELSDNIAAIVMPMKAGGIREKTNRALDETDFGFHDVFMDLPVMWMDSILIRLDANEVGTQIRVSSKEANILMDLVNFLNDNELFVGDYQATNRILSEISNTDSHEVLI